MNRLKRIWSDLRTSLWFVPSLIVAASIVFAVALIAAESTGITQWLAYWPRMFGAGAAGASGMLSTIAGAMMTVMGVTFSMTLLALALASSQYTSRILRNFMSDRVTQVVLGIFAGIFTYCLIVLRTIRGGDEGGYVSSLAVFFGVVLAIGGVGILIFFIHYVASSVQASRITAAIAHETMATMDRLFPDELGQGPSNVEEAQSSRPLSERKWQTVPVKGNGYINNVDNAALLHLSLEHNTIVRMERGIDKAYGIRKLRDILGISLKEMIFIGDALFPGGNDYPVEEAGVVSIPVRGPNETKRVTETIIACLDRYQ